MPKPFSSSLASALGASSRLAGALTECLDTAESSPFVRYREHAVTLRAMLPHIARMRQLLEAIASDTARRRSLNQDTEAP